LTPDYQLIKEEVKALYYDGDFDKVEKALSTFLKTRRNISQEDSIFSLKYLSVVYAANPDTKDKAEVMMYKLLKLVPTIELLDMYVSDSIQSIFSSVKQKIEMEREYQKKYDELGRRKSEEPVQEAKQEEQKPVATPAPIKEETPEKKAEAPDKKEKKKSGKGMTYIIIGGAVIVVTGIFLLLSGEEDAPSEERTLGNIDLSGVQP
jgi:hypothetical protein